MCMDKDVGPNVKNNAADTCGDLTPGNGVCDLGRKGDAGR